jgi:hypothetical protein
MLPTGFETSIVKVLCGAHNVLRVLFAFGNAGQFVFSKKFNFFLLKINFFESF